MWRNTSATERSHVPAVDVTYDTLPECTGNQRMFAAEYLPGQFDQRADSCEQCIQILLQGERCRVRTAQIYIISGNMTDAEFDSILESYRQFREENDWDAIVKVRNEKMAANAEKLGM